MFTCSRVERGFNVKHCHTFNLLLAWAKSARWTLTGFHVLLAREKLLWWTVTYLPFAPGWKEVTVMNCHRFPFVTGWREATVMNYHKPPFSSDWREVTVMNFHMQILVCHRVHRWKSLIIFPGPRSSANEDVEIASGFVDTGTLM